MPQGGQFFFFYLAADGALDFYGAVFQTGGLNAGILYFYKFMFVFVRLKVCCHNHAVGVRIAGHGKAQGRTAGGRPQRCRPPGKLPACIGYGFHGGAGAALFHFLAGGTADAAAGCGHKFHRYFSAAHGDRIRGD